MSDGLQTAVHSVVVPASVTVGLAVLFTSGPLPMSTVVTSSAQAPQSSERGEVTVAAWAVAVPVRFRWCGRKEV